MGFPPRRLSREQLVSLLYVAIVVGSLTPVAGATLNYVQWFDTLKRLDVQIDDAAFDEQFNLVVRTYVRNPTGFSGLKLESVRYVVFLNSTTENFAVQATGFALDIGVKTLSYAGIVLDRQAVLNATARLAPHSDLTQYLQDFLSRHPTDLIIFVSVTLTLRSQLGYLSTPYCYRLPDHEFTECPTPRTVARPQGPSLGGA